MEEIKDGFHYDIPEEVYFKLPFANSSSLKMLAMGGTPAHYKAKLDGDDTDSPAKGFGRLVHDILLRPHLFKNVEQLPPEIKKRAGKKWDELQAANPEVRYMPKAEYELFQSEKEIAYRIRDSILDHPVAGNFFKGEYQTEVTIIWTDPETGIRCKGRIDILPNDLSFIADPKTTTHTMPFKALKASYYFGYHIQTAMYTDAICILSEKADLINGTERLPSFYYIYVEKETPHLVFVADAHSCYNEGNDANEPFGYLQFGRDQYRFALKTVKHCMDSDQWEGHPLDAHEMVLPKFAGMEGVY
jgi:hypothetical protein